MGRMRLEDRALRGSDDHETLEQQLQRTLPDRTVFLSGEVAEHSIANVQSQLLAYASLSHKPIHLIVSTYGGSIDEMFGLYDLIKTLPCPIHTVGLGKVQSAGVLLMAAGTKGKRKLGANSSLMMHPLSGGLGGNVFELEATMNECKRQQRLMVLALHAETKMTEEQIKKIMRTGHDYFISPTEAIKLGIADSLLGAGAATDYSKSKL
jgi:ATP-dependent Clp protease protease subunit